MTETGTLAVDFHGLMEAVSGIGATPAGGVHRLAASAEDGAARDLLRDWLGAAGFEARIDAVGNLFCVKEWQPGRPWVLAGSHLDSQPLGGRLDGAYGVVAAAAAAKAVAAEVERGAERPPFNLAVVDWTNEEGARFQPSLIGSGSFVGALDGAAMLDVRDAQGVSLRQALSEIGYLGRDAAPGPVAAYAEVHIEQGRTLERSGLPVGLVTRNWAALKLQVVFHGDQAHTGPTLMCERRDALLAAAELITAVRGFAEGREERLHCSVGRLEIAPNSPNVVPALTRAHVELRSPDEALLAELEAELDRRIAEIATRTRCRAETASRSLRPVFHFDAEGGGGRPGGRRAGRGADARDRHHRRPRRRFAGADLSLDPAVRAQRRRDQPQRGRGDGAGGSGGRRRRSARAAAGPLSRQAGGGPAAARRRLTRHAEAGVRGEWRTGRAEPRRSQANREDLPR